jgi:hypothetical protein
VRFNQLSRLHNREARISTYTPWLLATFALAALTVLVPAEAFAQFRYPPPYAYGAPDSSLRILVTPKDASVYVDGYYAGVVDDFDGVFQRLRVTPGQHEVTVYLDGYRSLHEQLYLSPNSTRKITGTLEQLAPGDAPDPLPVPVVRPAAQQAPVFPGRRGRGAAPPPLPPGEAPPGETSAPPPPPASESPYGTIAVQIQPSGADLTIDGQHFEAPQGNDRLIVQLGEGPHTIEVRKNGYRGFVTDVDVRRGETLPVTVALARQ